VLVTLKLFLTDGREQLLSRELDAEEASLGPRELLERSSKDGRVVLGDRESCSLAAIVKVEVVQPESREGPTLEHGIRDEDISSAMRGNYEEP
jgi:hypothetical protein